MSRPVVAARARDELGLVPAEEPGPVIVLRQSPEAGAESFWDHAAGALEGVGGAVRTAQAGAVER